MLLLVGLAMAALGLLLILAGRLGLGHLPGDIVWRGEGWTVYVPLGWMILLSVAADGAPQPALPALAPRPERRAHARAAPGGGVRP